MQLANPTGYLEHRQRLLDDPVYAAEYRQNRLAHADFRYANFWSFMYYKLERERQFLYQCLLYPCGKYLTPKAALSQLQRKGECLDLPRFDKMKTSSGMPNDEYMDTLLDDFFPLDYQV